jgi:hypothetical protein
LMIVDCGMKSLRYIVPCCSTRNASTLRCGCAKYYVNFKRLSAQHLAIFIIYSLAARILYLLF